MQTQAFMRVLAVYIIAFALIFYNVSAVFSSDKENKKMLLKEEVLNVYEEGEKELSQPSVLPEQTPTSDVSQPQKTEQKTESSTVAAGAEAIKGKVLKEYISPYSAGLSYNNVYVKNSSGLKIDLKEMLESGLNFKIKKNEDVQVLIMHTHTTETYLLEDNGYYTADYTSRTTDNTKNMAQIGKIIADKLNSAGIKTLHDTTQHDYPKYSGSYTRSAATVNSYLKKYPSIKIVLDLHRDAVSAGGNDKVKLVTQINGKAAAQVMLVMGSNSGSVTNYPNWKENFKLALKLQQVMEVKYPTLARPISLMSKNYNQSLSTGSLLIEFGTDANTLSEAEYSAEMVADSLVTLLNNLQ